MVQNACLYLPTALAKQSKTILQCVNVTCAVRCESLSQSSVLQRSVGRRWSSERIGAFINEIDVFNSLSRFIRVRSGRSNFEESHCQRYVLPTCNVANSQLDCVCAPVEFGVTLSNTVFCVTVATLGFLVDEPGVRNSVIGELVLYCFVSEE